MRSSRIQLARFPGIFALLVAALLLLAACAPQVIPQSGAVKEIPLEVTDEAVNAPEQVAPGIQTFTTSNTSQMSRNLSVARLNTGATFEQFTEALSQGNDEAAVGLVSLIGGAEAPAGGSGTFVADLKEGTHVLIAFPQGDGPPVMGQFQVSGEPTMASAPQADRTVDMKDFDFNMPAEFKAGEQTWEIKNEGKQWHEMFIIKPNEGVTQEDIMTMLQSEEEPTGPPPFEDVGFFGPISQGERGWLEINLEPGNYMALCFLPDFASGESHAQKGMILEFRVTE